MIEYNIIKQLNFGLKGTIYLIKTIDNSYALKIEHI